MSGNPLEPQINGSFWSASLFVRSDDTQVSSDFMHNAAGPSRASSHRKEMHTLTRFLVGQSGWWSPRRCRCARTASQPIDKCVLFISFFFLPGKLRHKSWWSSLAAVSHPCVYVVNTWRKHGKSNEARALHSKRKKIMWTLTKSVHTQRHQKSDKVPCDLMAEHSIRDLHSSAARRNRIELNWSTTNENRTLSVWLDAVFLPMNFDHYCSIIIRIAWILFFAYGSRARAYAHLRAWCSDENVYTKNPQLDNRQGTSDDDDAETAIHEPNTACTKASIVNSYIDFTRVTASGNYSESECMGCERAPAAALQYNRINAKMLVCCVVFSVRSGWLLLFFFFFFFFVHANCERISTTCRVCLHVFRVFGAVCGPNSTFTFNRRVAGMRSASTRAH